MAREVDVDALVVGARAGEPRSVARLISLIEDGSPAVPEITRALVSAASRERAWVIGLTGAPGVGKSMQQGFGWGCGCLMVGVVIFIILIVLGSHH